MTERGRREKKKINIDVNVGDRVKAKFDDGDWYEGTVGSVKRGKVGEVVRVEIDYDDNTKEGCKWPDEDIVLVGIDESGKSRKRVKWGEVVTRYDVNEVDGERVFVCGEGECEYYSNGASVMKQHKANIHDIDVTYYYCDQKGCEYKAKKASKVKTHKAFIHDPQNNRLTRS